MSVSTQCCRCSESMKAVQKEPGRLWRKEFLKQMSFKSGEKGRTGLLLLSVHLYSALSSQIPNALHVVER